MKWLRSHFSPLYKSINNQQVIKQPLGVKIYLNYLMPITQLSRACDMMSTGYNTQLINY